MAPILAICLRAEKALFTLQWSTEARAYGFLMPLLLLLFDFLRWPFRRDLLDRRPTGGNVRAALEDKIVRHAV
jgi:hypothetical protein